MQFSHEFLDDTMEDDPVIIPRFRMGDKVLHCLRCDIRQQLKPLGCQPKRIKLN